MKIKLIAVGSHMPTWVQTASQDYLKRLPRQLSIEVVELPLAKRSKNSNPAQLLAEEGRRMAQYLGQANCETIALDVRGKMMSTEDVADKLQDWLFSGQTIQLLIGGPDGLAENCLQQAKSRWSLSRLTLPHPLVRVVLIEQLYRAWTLLQGHPYHRA